MVGGFTHLALTYSPIECAYDDLSFKQTNQWDTQTYQAWYIYIHDKRLHIDFMSIHEHFQIYSPITHA